MALGLGLGWSIILEGSAAAAVIDDYFFELSSGDLQPRASFVDNSDAWDLDSNSDIMPATTPIEEGYFEVDGSGDLQPKA
tara:strand:- start:497 stop:736 length:240 start_codon:yes stop_codon:yes gene_type:complete